MEAGGSGGEGHFYTAGGVALVAGGALPAAVVVQITRTTGAYAVHFSMGELGAFHVHFNLLCPKTRAWSVKSFDTNDTVGFFLNSGEQQLTSVRLGAVGVDAGAQAVRADPLPVGLQLRELPLQVPLLPF